MLGLGKLRTNVQIAVDAPLGKRFRFRQLQLKALISGVPTGFLQGGLNPLELLEPVVRHQFVAGSIRGRGVAVLLRTRFAADEASNGQGRRQVG